MYGFLDRLINLALPRIRAFFRVLILRVLMASEITASGLEEQLMFPRN